MALPTLTKTWQHSVNNQTLALGTALADNKRTMRGIKNALIGFATNPAVVKYSCNGTTAGTAGDGVDRWSADSDLVWANAGTAHSWIVLLLAGISSNHQVLISLEGASGAGAIVTIYESQSVGFSGGSTTARPTATDEFAVSAGGSWSSSSDISARFHVMQSTDGQCTRVVLGQSSKAVCVWIFDKPQNPSTGWTNPSVGMLAYNASGLPIATFVTTGTPLARMRNGSTNGNVTFTVEGIGNSFPSDTAIGNIANEIDATWDLWPVGLACLTTGIRGRHGTLFDAWFGSAVIADGECYPDDGSKQFAQFGCWVLPWNGTTVTLS